MLKEKVNSDKYIVRVIELIEPKFVLLLNKKIIDEEFISCTYMKD